jgi:hypothetical protein
MIEKDGDKKAKIKSLILLRFWVIPVRKSVLFIYIRQKHGKSTKKTY